MHYSSFRRLLEPTPDHPTARYAIVDCAATETDNTIYSKIISEDVEKYILFTGENSWSIDHVAPFLLPLDSQPDLEKWLVESGWGIFFTSDADIKTLLAHFRQYLELQAPNGRDIFFRFYDPVILGDFVPVLSKAEAMAFFGPVARFVIENDQGEAVVFEKPEGESSDRIDPSHLVTAGDKRTMLSRKWQQRLLAQHVKAYERLGFKAVADVDTNTVAIKDKAGAAAQLKKTGQGVETTTGENRRFQYELTSCKHPAKVTDPAGHSISFDIQERHNKEYPDAIPVLSAIRMNGGGKTWVFDYDEAHHLKRIDYPDGTHAKISHDSYGHLSSYADRNGNTSHFERDFEERLTNFKDANGHSTRFHYNDLTAPSSIAFSDGKIFNFEYTDAGALERFLTGNTLVADYEVDRESGSWKVNYTDGGHAHFVVQGDKIIRAANAAGTVELAYDEAGNLIKETFQNRSVRYHRNETGQLTGLTTPFNQTLQYTLDKENRVCAIKEWSGRHINIRYGLSGALESITYPNGTHFEQQTNAQGLPTQMHLRGAEGILYHQSLERDLLNRITHIDTDRQHIAYTYDKEGRLLMSRSNTPDLNETFTLDAKANRLADDNTEYIINEADRLEQAGTATFRYDSLGNLIQGRCPKGDADFSFTDLNRLKSISTQKGRVRYLYDAFGRRVAKKANGVTTRFYWAQSTLLHEAQINETAGKKSIGVIDYLFFPETPVLLAIRQNRQTRWAAFGHRYEVLCLTNEGGQLVWQAHYDAFGKAHIAIGADIHQPFRLAGQYYDQESGLHYNLARYYDPSLGRFLSLDPLFLEGGSENFYAYCNGDPINHIDPGGEFIFCAILIGAAIGAAVGGGLEAMRQSSNGGEIDGYKIAKAALIGGAIGAIGGGVGTAVEAAAGAGALGTTMAASTFKGMAAVGFLSGAGSSVAEQCAEARMTGTGINPLSMAQQALTDGGIGAVLSPGGLGFVARRLRKAGTTALKPVMNSKKVASLTTAAKDKSRNLTARVKSAASKKTDKSKLCQDGDPVNSVTGEVILSQNDFTLPGRIPLTWTRHYGSQSDYSGLLGTGWQTPADARLELDNDGLVTFYDGSPGGAIFEKLPTDEPVMEASDGAVLAAAQDHYRLKLKSGLTYHFPKTFLNNQSHAARISDVNGNYLSFDRKEGILTQIRDNSGQCIHVECRRGHIVSMVHHDKPLARYSYQGDRLAGAMDALGHQKRFYYQGGRLVRHMDKNKLSFYYEYDDKGRCTHAWGDNGLYDYRFDHRPYERSVAVTDSLGHEKTYFYDKNRLPVKEQDHTGAAFTYEYDEVGRIIKVTDPLERNTEYEYDPAGNVIEIIRPDGHRIAMVYDADQHPVQMLDANGQIWEQRFDDKGRLIEKTNPLCGSTQYSYNHQGDLETVTDPEGRTTFFEYDSHGLVATVLKGNNHPTYYQRDLLGNITAVIDPAGRTTRYVYDDKFRLVQAVQPSGTDQSFEWDPEDNLVLHTDPYGQQTRFEYGGVNEIVRRINADGTTVSYQYDSEENLIGVTNEKNQTHRFKYDHAGRVTAQTDYYGHTTHYTYDPAGQLIQSLDPLERTITYAYDEVGRLQTKTFENEEQEYFKWDANGNLIGFQSPGAMVEREYDAANNLIAEKNGEFVVEYQYDQSGRRTGRTTGNGHHIKYNYDEAGDIASIQINDHDPVTIQRNELGQITKESFSRYLNRSYSYSEDGLLTRQTIDGAVGQIERLYEYDAAGNLIGKQDNQKGPWRFGHDPMGRIIEALDPEHQLHRFSYDPAGDLLEHMPDIGYGLRSAKYNNTLYQYDAVGNLVERRNSEERTHFAWDEHNRLTTVRKADDTCITMSYDALGRRCTKAVNGQRTFFKWDGDTLLSEQLEDGPAREYVYYPGTFEPLAVIDGDGQIYYYHNDLNGLPQELTDPNGTIVWSATYDAMGRVDQILVDKVAQPLRLQGQYYDPEIDLCYNRYRYFDPQICSFISQDPLGLAAGENIYAYGPNVWGWVDPLGLSCDHNLPKKVNVNKAVKEILEGRDVTVGSFKEADEVLFSAFPGARKMPGAGPKSGSLQRKQVRAFREARKKRNGVYFHKDYLHHTSGNNKGVLFGHESLPDGHPHKTQAHINIEGWHDGEFIDRTIYILK